MNDEIEAIATKKAKKKQSGLVLRVKPNQPACFSFCLFVVVYSSIMISRVVTVT
jgi:hypothetical protein